MVADALVGEAVLGDLEKDWKDIKPAKNYQEIKRKGFIDQKKRDYQQMRKTQIESSAERRAMPYKMQRTQTASNLKSMATSEPQSANSGNQQREEDL